MNLFRMKISKCYELAGLFLRIVLYLDGFMNIYIHLFIIFNDSDV